MVHRVTHLWAIILATAIVAAGCGAQAGAPTKAPAPATAASGPQARKAAASTPQSVALAVTAPPSAGWVPYQLARSRGFYARQGLQVRIITIKTQAAEAALAAGQVQYFPLLTPALESIAKGLPFRIVMATNIEIYDLIAQPQVTSVRGLAGRTIGTTVKYGNFYNAAVAILAHSGLQPSQVKFLTFSHGSTIYAALDKHLISAGILSSPLNFMAEGAGFHNLASSGAVYSGSLDGLVTTVSNLKDHPKQVRGMIRGTLDAVAFIKDHPNATQQFMQSYLKEGPAIVSHAYADLLAGFKGAGPSVTPTWVSNALRLYVHPAKPIAFDQAIDLGPLQQVQSST